MPTLDKYVPNFKTLDYFSIDKYKIDSYRLDGLQSSSGGGIDSFTKLMLHFNGSNGSTTFTDSAFTPHTFTASGNAQISTAQSVFGGSSLLLDGTGDFLTSSTNDSYWDFMTSAFTIDFRVRFIALPTTGNNMCFMSRELSTSNQWNISVVNESGTIKLAFFSYPGTSFNDIKQAASISLNTWYHIAYVYTGSVMKIFLNGTQLGTDASINASYLVNPAGYIRIGSFDGSIQYLNAYMDELRWSNVARWTSNFTIPGAEYTT